MLRHSSQQVDTYLCTEVLTSGQRHGSRWYDRVMYQKTEDVLDGQAITECTRARAKRKESRAERQTGIITLMESRSSRYVQHIWEPPCTRRLTSNVLFGATLMLSAHE
jgi:hypothetical protein